MTRCSFRTPEDVALPDPRQDEIATPSRAPWNERAGDGTRTRDPWLGKPMLYQLSYSRGCGDCSPAIMEPQTATSETGRFHAEHRAARDRRAHSSPRGRGSSPPTRAPARSRSASTRSASSRPRRTAAPTATSSSRRRAPRSTSAASSSTTRRSARRPTTGRRSRSCSPRRAIIPGIKVDAGREAARARRGRDGDRGPRRAARAARGVPRARRPLREVARDVLDQRHDAERVLHLDERARARPLRGALPGGRDRPDRRARGAAGRDAHDRAQRLRHLARARRRLHRAVRPARRRRGDAAQAEHGPLRLRGVRRAPASTRSPRRRCTR